MAREQMYRVKFWPGNKEINILHDQPRWVKLMNQPAVQGMLGLKSTVVHEGHTSTRYGFYTVDEYYGR
jgi:hypothetical protein